MKSFFKRIKPYLAPIIITLVALILFHVVFMLGYVPSDSMEPTLEAGSLILGLRIHGQLGTYPSINTTWNRIRATKVMMI